MSPRRGSRGADGGLAACPCGGSWFELRNDDGTAGAICIEDGEVAGFAGTPTCTDCGEPLVGRGERLRLVL